MSKFEQIQKIHSVYNLNIKKIAVLQRLFNHCVVGECSRMNIMAVTDAEELEKNINLVNKDNRSWLNDSFDKLTCLLAIKDNPQDLADLNRILSNSDTLVIKGELVPPRSYNAEYYEDKKVLIIRDTRGKTIIRIYDILNHGFFKNFEIEQRIKNAKDALNDKLNKF